MNILTYASPVSISPYTWAISLYKGTQSFENFQIDSAGVLQSLTKTHIPYFEYLGKKSVKSVDKLHALKNAGAKLSAISFNHSKNIESFSVLEECPLLICVKKRMDVPPIDLGDHTLYICSVSHVLENSYYSGNNSDEVLDTNVLKNNGFL